MNSKIALFIASLLIVFSCEDISEENRFSGVPLPIVTGKNVLLEDFTGQLCQNCPYAAEAISNIQRLYGERHIIAVTIHGGDLSLDETKYPVGLATTLGTAYHNDWGIDHWPCGMVDRKGPYEYTSWSGLVTKRLQEPLQADISITNLLDTGNSRLTISVSAEAKQDIVGKLQIWLIEDSIRCPQIMPDGAIDGTYLHRHVFRASVNAPYGDDIAILAGKEQTFCYEYLMNDKWNSSQLYVLAFIYNEHDGVIQVEKEKAKCI